MKIIVVCTGYVGLSLAVLLDRKNIVTAVDVAAEKVNLINQKKSPIQDKEIEEYLSNWKGLIRYALTMSMMEHFCSVEYTEKGNLFADIKDWTYQAAREKV